MSEESLYQQFLPKERNFEEIAVLCIRQAKLINYLLSGLEDKNVRIKYGCLNTLVTISDKSPQSLYANFDLFVELLNSDKKIFKLASIKIISNITQVDSKNKFEKIYDIFFSFIKDEDMTTAANVCKGVPKIVRAKPYLAEKIVYELLQIPKIEYKTHECKNILIGQAINAFSNIFANLENETKIKIIQFAEKNKFNPRKTTKNKAEKFLKMKSSL